MTQFQRDYHEKPCMTHLKGINNHVEKESYRIFHPIFLVFRSETCNIKYLRNKCKYTVYTVNMFVHS
jgi:hypothetical protein